MQFQQIHLRHNCCIFRPLFLICTLKITFSHGAIIAERVDVLKYNYWPDYVFDETYELMSLENLSIFIDQNNHLPNVPSEKIYRNK